MTRRTRSFVIGSLLILAIGLGTGLFAYYGGLPGWVAGGLDGPDELSYVPKDVALVAYANVREIMASDVRQRIRRVMPAPEDGQRQFQEQTGIDLESDIDYLVASLLPQPDGRAAGLIVARGRFSDVKIEALMREHGAQVEEYGGKRVIASRNLSPTGDESIALSFLEPGVMAVGGMVMVQAAIDLQKSGDNVTKNAELMEQLGSVDSGSAWVVGRLDALRSSAQLPAVLEGRLPAITWFSVSGRVDREIRGVVRADARDEEAGNNLRDMVRGFLAFAKLQAGARPEFQTMVQSLELSGSGNRVMLSFAIPEAVLDALPTRRQK